MPITSTHSFYCKAFGLEAKARTLGEIDGDPLGATLSIFTSDDYAERITLFVDNVEYAKQLAEAINSVGRRFFLEEAA